MLYLHRLTPPLPSGDVHCPLSSCWSPFHFCVPHNDCACVLQIWPELCSNPELALHGIPDDEDGEDEDDAGADEEDNGDDNADEEDQEGDASDDVGKRVRFGLQPSAAADGDDGVRSPGKQPSAPPAPAAAGAPASSTSAAGVVGKGRGDIAIKVFRMTLNEFKDRVSLGVVWWWGIAGAGAGGAR